MRSRTSVYLYTMIFLFIMVPEIMSGDPVRTEDPAAKIDEYLSGIYKPDRPGVAVLAVREGQIIIRKGYGLADMELNVPVRPEMIFRIGSITKQFTAAAVMILVDEGKIRLDDLITVYLPDYPLKGKKVNIRHLLNHTSGIKSYTSMPEFMKRMREDMAVSQIIDMFKDQPFDFDPGEKFSYNNSGYILLGAIIEKLSGKTYAEFINERIFEKAGMKNSSYDNASDIIRNRAKGYSVSGEVITHAPYLSMTLPYAAGSLISTVDDLYAWNRYLNSGKLISKDLLKKMYTRTKLNDGEEVSYGFGYMMIDFRGVEEVHHGGGINGFITNAVYIPQKDLFVAVFSNSTGYEPSPQFVSQWITALLLGKPYSEETGEEISEKEADEYTGVYRINAEENRTVTRDGNRLFTLRTGGSRQEIFHRSKDTFFYKDSFTWLTFDRDRNDGRITGMTVHSLNGTEKAERTGEKVKERKVARIDTSIYKQFEGNYQMDGFQMNIYITDGKLMAQATGQGAVELLPSSDYSYFVRDIDAVIEFIRDGSGAITGLTLVQGNVKMEGRRL